MTWSRKIELHNIVEDDETSNLRISPKFRDTFQTPPKHLRVNYESPSIHGGTGDKSCSPKRRTRSERKNSRTEVKEMTENLNKSVG